MSEIKPIRKRGRPSGVSGTTAARNKARFFPACPDGWMGVDLWARRMGVDQSAVRKQIGAGRIPEKWMAKTKAGERGHKLILEWDHLAYFFIMNRDPLLRPADFFENEAQVYRPLKAPEPTPADGVKVGPLIDEYHAELEQNKVQLDEGGEELELGQGDLLSGNMLSMRVVDIPTARFRQQQLKIMKDQIDLKVARGEVMKMKDVEGMLLEIATDIKGQFVQLVARYAPALAACSDPREVRRILEDALKDAIDPLTAKNGTN